MPNTNSLPRNAPRVNSSSSISKMAQALMENGMINTNAALVQAPMRGSSLVGVPPAGASGSQGLSQSFSHTSVSNINKSLSTLDAKTLTRDLKEATGDQTVKGNAWQTVCVKVLPLFNGQGLKGHMEDMNELVSIWLSDAATQTVTEELNELLSTGMMTLGNKIATVGDELLANRLVEVWSFYFGTVVPYLQGVFLPVRTQWRTVGGRIGDPPDVRQMALAAFRDHIIGLLGGRLTDVFPKLAIDIENGRKVNDTASRLMQMLNIMSGLQGDSKPVTKVLNSFKHHMMGNDNRSSIANATRIHTSA